MPSEIEGWHALSVADSCPSKRLTDAIAAIWYVSSTVWSGANFHARPKEDLTGWALDADPPCLLNALYLALFGSFVTGNLPRRCSLTDCRGVARPASEWCSVKHADTHRQRRKRVANEWGLSDSEIDKMESLVRAEGLAHHAAAERVVSLRRKRR